MNLCYPFVNEPLPYDYDSLEPCIDAKTMKLHHDRHLQAYIDNLNELLKEHPTLQKRSLTDLVTNWRFLPAPLCQSVRNQAGGVYNHRFFFEGMEPSKESFKAEWLSCELAAQFGSVERFKSCFKQAALKVFGSGYGWLVWERGRLCITTTANQDTPLARGQCPILCIDLWEHAYYLKHYNMRADYIENWFCVVNWSRAERLLSDILCPNTVGIYGREDGCSYQDTKHNQDGYPRF